MLFQDASHIFHIFYWFLYPSCNVHKTIHSILHVDFDKTLFCFALYFRLIPPIHPEPAVLIPDTFFLLFQQFPDPWYSFLNPYDNRHIDKSGPKFPYPLLSDQ